MADEKISTSFGFNKYVILYVIKKVDYTKCIY